MANRPAWTIEQNKINLKYFDFPWASGLSVSQKQKNVYSLHQSIAKASPQPTLEVSTKSPVALGKELSAFNLKYNNQAVERIFQSSKVFEDGGPYPELLNLHPSEIKKDPRLKNSGKIISFRFNDQVFPTEPKTLFYDYFYIKAMIQNYGYDLDLLKYKWFTDIEFNPARSINCQARSVAIYKLLQLNQLWYTFDTLQQWQEFHEKNVLG